MKNYEQYGLKPYGAVPNARQMAHWEMEKKAFIHFGMNTFTNVEWGNGLEDPKSFAPTTLDARQWVRSLKECGFGLIILTAKHHDGFCLWPSAVTEHCVKNSGYSGDVVKEFTDACREYGVKAGIYLSPWDRNSPYWGQDAYNDYYIAQLTELLGGHYGPIYEVWWDGAGSTETQYDWKRWAETVRTLQPEASIFGSLGASEYVDFRWVGNERGVAGETHYASIDLTHLQVENTAGLNRGNQGGEWYIPSETDVSIRPGWFYRSEQDGQVKCAARLNKLWFESVGRNSLLLLNFPPDTRGLLHEKDLKNALDSHRCIQKMRSVDYVASVTAERTLPNGAWVGNTLEITLKEESLCNVLLLGEVLELGERVSAFTVESEGEVLFQGTSVGHCRACLLPERKYRSFKVTFTAPVVPVIGEVKVHRFEDLPDDPPTSTVGLNLAELSAAKTTFTPDLREAVVNFGGVYPFNMLRFVLEEGGSYEVFAFNGTEYESITTGSCDQKTRFKVVTDRLIEGSYQVKVVSTAPLSEIDAVQVKWKPEEDKK
ncbi:MAG: alpha-L-fucosidase [Clostridia bacterium]|nr:alpha-L-fucosidase [Clostridia bacterium]